MRARWFHRSCPALQIIGLAVTLAAAPASPLWAGSIVQVDQVSSDSAVTISQSGGENRLLLTVGSGLDALSADRLSLNATQAGSLNTMAIEVGAGAHDSTINAIQNGDLHLLTIRSRAASATISTEQRGDAKTLTIDVALAASGGLINVSQSGAGAHVGEIALLSPNQSVVLSQAGGLPGASGGHLARVTLDGDPRVVDIRQSGTVPREITVSTVGGCSGACEPLVFRQD